MVSFLATERVLLLSTVKSATKSVFGKVVPGRTSYQSVEVNGRSIF